MGRTRLTATLLALAVVSSGPGGDAHAQAQDPGAPASPDLPRIRRELDRPTSGIDWSLPSGTPMFRINVEEKFPDFSTWLGDPRDLRRGPMVYPSSHDQFLRMVTPEEVGAAYSNGELAQVLATGLAFGFALQQATSAIRNGISSLRSRRACEEVAATLADLNRERARAGLPPVPAPGC